MRSHALADAGIGTCYQGYLTTQSAMGRHICVLLVGEEPNGDMFMASTLQRARTQNGPWCDNTA